MQISHNKDSAVKNVDGESTGHQEDLARCLAPSEQSQHLSFSVSHRPEI